MSKETDRWLEFIKEYDKQSSTPLSFVLCPNTNNGFRSPGSPLGFTKLSKREWQKVEKKDDEA